jgi:hypothetical protein
MVGLNRRRTVLSSHEQQIGDDAEPDQQLLGPAEAIVVQRSPPEPASPATDDLNRSRPNRRNQVSIATVERNIEFATPAVAPLTLADRCDASAVVGGPNGRTGRGDCGAQGFIRAVLPSGNDLVFCGHHGREHEAALAAAGATVHDGTDALNA